MLKYSAAGARIPENPVRIERGRYQDLVVILHRDNEAGHRELWGGHDKILRADHARFTG